MANRANALMKLFIEKNPFKDSVRSDAVLAEPEWNDAETAADAESRNKWFPAVDILENDSEYLFKLDLPGVKKNQIRVLRDRETLVVSGGRHLTDGKARTLRQERPRGYFLRRLPLADDASRIEIKARLAEGVLQIAVRKVRFGLPEHDYPEQAETSIG